MLLSLELVLLVGRYYGACQFWLFMGILQHLDGLDVHHDYFAEESSVSCRLHRQPETCGKNGVMDFQSLEWILIFPRYICIIVRLKQLRSVQLSMAIVKLMTGKWVEMSFIGVSMMLQQFEMYEQSSNQQQKLF